MRLLLSFVAAILAAMSLLPAHAASKAATAHAQAALLVQTTQLQRGADNWVGVELRPAQGWHTYWRNPGDAGLPTRLQWTLPDGVSAGDIQWPAPQRLMVEGIGNFGYEHPVLLMVPVRVPEEWSTRRPLTLDVTAHWLICKTICVPEQVRLSRTLDVTDKAATADAQTTAAFTAARAALPQPLPQTSRARFDAGADTVSVAVKGLPERGDVVFFPATPGLIDASAPQRVAMNGDDLRLSVRRAQPTTTPPPTLSGVLEITTAQGAHHAYAVAAAPGSITAVAATTTAVVAAGQPSLPSLLTLAGLALLGGLLLNLMPCVFPVLSIKAMSLLGAGPATTSQRRHALAYTVGVVLSCVAAAAVLLALRNGGAALGWGFQLQSPPFVGALALLLFALGLSMSGIYSIGGRLMGAGQHLAAQEGLAGAFFTGVLAVVVASPCSAPFMGTALGAALTQPLLASLTIFAALGLGLALPFLLIGFVPALARLLPKPGAWMETFKQVMAFPLYLSAVWLVWVLTRQSGADATAVLLVAMVILSLGLWARGRWPQSRAAAITALAAVAIALGLLAHPALRNVSGKAVAQHVATASGDIQPYSAARLDALRAQGRTVFVNFTADWCLTCKVNEHVALASDAVHNAFAKHHVAWLEGDWTRSDPAITQALARFGRSGVPLYLVYRDGGKPQVLPQLLTPGIVVAAVSGG